jgi:elongation factor G
MAKEASINLSKYRNIGVIAHIDAGKTTTTEHLLYFSGAKHRLGTVDSGTTETDYDQEEQERGITIYSACVPLVWQDCTINLIDTPGHVDFTAEVERSLRVLDGCVCVFDAQKGVEAQSETVWRQADRYHVPRIVFINKMDVVGANFANVVEEIRESLDGHPLPLVIPIGSGSDKDSATPFRGVIDLITQKAIFFDAANFGRTYREEAVPEDMLDQVKTYRDRLFDTLSQSDDQDRITSAYLEGKEVTVDAIRAAIRDQTIKRQIQPVLAGSGREHIGIQPLLDAVCWYLPSPLDRPPVTGINPKKPDKEEKRKPDPKEPFCGLVFKVVADAHGELFYARIYSGTLKANSRMYNPGKDVKENITKLYRVHADPKRGREEIPNTQAGDIVAIQGLRDAITGDTLCDYQHPILLESIRFAEAVVSQSIEPESSNDRDKLVQVLNVLKREDPTFTWKDNPDTGQKLMYGMGKLHLEVKVHRMERDFKLKVRVGTPYVSYRETLKKPIRVEGECVRQVGAQMFAKMTVEFDNEKSDQPVTVLNRAPAEKLPSLLAAAAERGLKNALQTGAIGYPVLHVQATIVDAQVDPQLSSEMAFEAAANDAAGKALRDNIILLEPIMRVEVQVPNEFYGAISGDLSAKGAEIQSSEVRGNWWTIEALVPLARMFDYAEEARSLSQGRASSTMEPHSYRPAPKEVLEGILNPI